MTSSRTKSRGKTPDASVIGQGLASTIDLRTVQPLDFGKRTVGDFVRDAREDGLRATLADRGMWGRMRMTPTDLSDVNANTYTYLLNGAAPAGNWTGLFKPGEKVLLRFINGSSMTYFDLRIPRAAHDRGRRRRPVCASGQRG